MDVGLADGTEVHRGDQILELHLWNEHLLSLPSHGAGLGRGNVLRRRMTASLYELARHMASDPSLHAIEAVRARPACVPRNRAGKLVHIARAYGLNTAESPGAYPAWRQWCDFWQNFWIWALAWTFNPAALRGNRLLRTRCELW